MRFGIIDLSSLVYPLWHALDTVVDSCGNGIHAVFAVHKYLEDLRKDHSHLVVAVDRGADHRRAIFPDYKSNRTETDEDLVRQLRLAESLCAQLGVPVIGKEGYEADDVIATLTSRLEDAGRVDLVVIHSNDKDQRQLLSDRTMMFTKKKGWYTVDSLLDDWGIYPQQVVDFQALMGDTSDGIPGVKNMGAKTATVLIKEYFDLDGIYANLERIRNTEKVGSFKGATIADRLEGSRQEAFMSHRLCKLVSNLELDIDPSATRLPAKSVDISRFLYWLGDPSVDPGRYLS